MTTRDPSTVVRFFEWFVSLDKPKQGNIRILAFTGFVGLMIYTRPEFVGPWAQAVFSAADLKTWALVSLGGFAAFNMMASSNNRETRLELHIGDLRLRIETLERALVEKDAEHLRRMEDARADFMLAERLVADARDHCYAECSLHRSALVKMVVLASGAGCGTEVQAIVDGLDAELRHIRSHPVPEE